MVEDNLYRWISKARGAVTRGTARVVVASTLCVVPLSLTAQVVSCAALGAFVQLSDLEEVLPVAQDAKLCSSCREIQRKRGREPRRLVTLPSGITGPTALDEEGKPLFNKPNDPIFVCRFCDGDVLQDARAAHDERTRADESGT